MEITENGGFKFAVKTEDIHYQPNFVSEAEERRLLEHVYAAPKPKWRQLANRRLQNWGGAVMTGGGGEDKQQPAGQGCLIQDGERLPKWLDECIDKIMALNGGDDVPTTSGSQSAGVPSFPAQRRPNHVLINEYRPGQGIMPHTDGPAFFPLISTLSLGSHTLLNFYEEKRQQQQHHEHGQQQREEQKQKREHENGDGKGREDEEEKEEGEERQPQFPAAAAAAADESNNERRRIGSSSSRRPVGSLLLEPRSLVLISGQAYRWLHGIEELETDTIVDARRTLLNWSQLGQPLPAKGTVKMERGTRISLTIRNVPRVKRLCLLPAFSHRK